LPRKKASSSVNDNQKANDYILPRLGRIKVADVTRIDVNDLHRELANKPYQKSKSRLSATKNEQKDGTV
jgi:hypothetical protein